MRTHTLIVISLILAFAVRSLHFERVSVVLSGVVHSDMSADLAESGEEGWEESSEYRATDAEGFARWRLPMAIAKQSYQVLEGRYLGERAADDIPTPPPDRLG